MVTTKQYDFLNRLQSISSVPSASSVVNFSYDYNSANQRTLRREADGSYWRYGFDSLGQVKSGKKYWADGTPVAGQQFEYGFDDIGNRKQTNAGGDENGLNLRTNTYGANLLNQYTNRSVQGAVDVMGLAIATNTVTVNSSATYRKGEYFRKELSVANTSVPVWQQVDVAAPNETSVTRHEFVPKTPEALTYDADGNLTSDGRWTNTWDAENRLVKVESLSTSPTASKRKVIWEFDGKGRRTRQTTYDGTSGSYVVSEDLKFLSDGWRHIAELNATNNAVIRGYVWGLDLSGTMDGAGGVGGLLMMDSAASGIHFHAFDGNGNVAALVKASDGASSATYEYGPFGEPLRVTGVIGNENSFRFSTKRTSDPLGLVLYEYRPYSPLLGRWLGWDPVGEGGGRNLSIFAGNSPVQFVDSLGLTWEVTRVGGDRALAVCECRDTWDDLARKIHFDTKDYRIWAQTTDQQPVPGKMYSIPNVIQVDTGEVTAIDEMPTAIIHIWKVLIRQDKARWERKGFRVLWDDGVMDSDIKAHLGNANLHGYVFIGHGGKPAIINTYSHIGTDHGVIANRYTRHGIAFMQLDSCYSAAKVWYYGKPYKFNPWESNVATRGWFGGYKGLVITLNELFEWAVTPGTNDKGVTAR